MVFPKDADLGVGVAQRPAIEEEDEFHYTGYPDGDGRGEVEGFGAEGGTLGLVEIAAAVRAVVACGELHDREDDDQEGNRGHEEAEDDIASGFNAGFAGGEAPRVDFADGAVADYKGDIREGVEYGVDHGGEE